MSQTREEAQKPKAEHVMQIEFDGGCSPNPGNKYGSYSIKLNGQERKRELRFGLGYGTNNEAEFEALEAALNSAVHVVAVLSMAPRKAIRLVILTDSTIVRNHLNRVQKNKHQEPRRAAMIERANRCKALLNKFHSFEVKWQGRENNVANFGH